MAYHSASAHVDYRASLQKTRLCNFWARGDCSFGSDCRFAHGQHEIQDRPDFRKTKMCFYKDFPDGCRVKDCRFAHFDGELIQTVETGTGTLEQRGRSSESALTDLGSGSQQEESEVSSTMAQQDLAGWSLAYEFELNRNLELFLAQQNEHAVANRVSNEATSNRSNAANSSSATHNFRSATRTGRDMSISGGPNMACNSFSKPESSGHKKKTADESFDAPIWPRLCGLVVGRVEAFARAAARSNTPLPTLSAETIYYEAYVLDMAGSDTYED